MFCNTSQGVSSLRIIENAIKSIDESMINVAYNLSLIDAKIERIKTLELEESQLNSNLAIALENRHKANSKLEVLKRSKKILIIKEQKIKALIQQNFNG